MEGPVKRMRMRTVVVVSAALLLTTLAITGAQGSSNPGVLPPNSKVQGLTYGQWSTLWWQYVFSIPAAQNPLIGNNGDRCALKRVGNVALDVTFGQLGAPIKCTVPAGTMLYMELLAAECSNLEAPPFYGGHEQELRACAHTFVPHDMEASIDDVKVQNPGQYLVESPLYGFKVPADNILGVPAGTIGKSVAYGAYLMIAPLMPGKHTIHVYATYPDMGFVRDVTLDLTVTTKR